MRPEKPTTNNDLFKSRLDAMINLNHPLAKLSRVIDWTAFEKKFGPLYRPDFGRPALPIRLMVGLTYLSRIYDLSDEAVVDMWLENPYWQYFCGYEYFQHQFPLDPSSLVRWRKRLGADGMEFLLQQTVATAFTTGQLTEQHVAKVNVDTTVQEKNIAFPTDSKLYHRCRERLVKEARKQGIDLRQTYARVSKKILFQASNYGRARQFKRAGAQTKKLKTLLGRVVRDIRRKCHDPGDSLQVLLQSADRLLEQKRNSKNKLYSVHAPEVECIAKGKAHKHYEFGCKVSVASTSRDNWVVGIQAHHGNPYDGHTLPSVIDQIERLTGLQPGEVYCDQGYRGSGYSGDTRIIVVDRKRKTKSRSERKWKKRRAAIEPIIGHLKSDHRMGRNYLQGKAGDVLNALMAGCGRNLRKLLQILFYFIFVSRFSQSANYQIAFAAE